MIHTSENNWYSWNYGDNERFGRQSDNLPFYTNYGKLEKPLRSFKQELLDAAKSTLDHYPGLRPCVFFSGGVDSELVLRSYIEIGSNPEVYIVRYEKDLNLYDVSYAVAICSSLQVDYHLIDFSLESFYQNDAEKISEDAQIDRPSMLPHLKFTEVADGLIIVGHSDVRWYRPSDDYSQKVSWLAQDFEHDIGCDKYNILHNRSAIYQWWKWTPGLVLSYTKLNWFRKLISDGYVGKLGINSTKIIGFREVYPDMLYRKKFTGLERIDYITKEFENYLERKYKGLPFRNEIDRSLDDLWLEMTGKSYLEYGDGKN